MHDESYWYGPGGWRVLRGRIIRLGLEQADILGTEGRAIPERSRSFVQQLITDLSQKVSSDRVTLWNFALPLFARPEMLSERISATLEGLETAEPPEHQPDRAFLGETLRRYLEDMRRELDFSSAARRKVWERLDRISRTVTHQQKHTFPIPENPRCDEAHWKAVLDHIRAHYPADQNLPRSMDTMEAYFLEFCVECEHLAETEVAALLYAAEPGPFPGQSVLATLEECLEHLVVSDSGLYEAVDVKFQLGRVSSPSALAYRNEQGVSRREFENRICRALERLRGCLENGVDAMLTTVN